MSKECRGRIEQVSVHRGKQIDALQGLLGKDRLLKKGKSVTEMLNLNNWPHVKELKTKF